MLVLNSLWLYFHLVPLRSSSTNQFLSPCGFLSVAIMLGKEFCKLYKTLCGKFLKFWTCHLVVEFSIFWLLCCFCSSLVWHCCEFTCFWRLKVFEEKSNVKTGNSLVAVTNFPFAVHLLLAYIASHFHASYIFQVHQNPKGVQLPLPHDLQLYWSNISN